MLIVLIALPFGVWLLLWKKQSNLLNEGTILTYGSTYAELRVDSKPALLYNVVQMFRRLVFAVTCALIGDQSGI